MTKMTRKGATVEAAILVALQALGAKREDVEIEVIDQGKKGFLGFGARQAEVVVTTLEVDVPTVIKEQKGSTIEKEQEVVLPIDLSATSLDVVFDETVEPDLRKAESRVKEPSDEEAAKETEQYLKDIATSMGIKDLQVGHEIAGKYVTFQLESEKAAMLIGKRGQTLNALQQLSQLIVNKRADQFKVVRVDVGDYRERREQSLEQFAERMADKAVRSGKKVQLEPMPSYERKTIHNALSNRLDIETYSEGSDPHRYLVIESMK